MKKCGPCPATLICYSVTNHPEFSDIKQQQYFVMFHRPRRWLGSAGWFSLRVLAHVSGG